MGVLGSLCAILLANAMGVRWDRLCVLALFRSSPGLFPSDWCHTPLAGEEDIDEVDWPQLPVSRVTSSIMKVGLLTL